MNISEALTFDDVLLKPKRSSVTSRKDVDLKTRISRNIELNIPFISANMDTVTESRMAIEIARLGGLGVIHRFLPIEKEAEEVAKVKRAENYVVEEPFTIGPEATLKTVKELMRRLDVQTFIVVDGGRKLTGILTKRDYIFENRDSVRVRDIMTPLERLVIGKSGTSLEEAKSLFQKHKIEKLPLVDSDGNLVGLITARDILHRMNPLAVRDGRGRLLVGAAVGVRGDYLQRAEALVEAGVNILVVDIAHGHLEICIDAVKTIKRKFPEIDLMAGNVATKEGARDLIEAGADSIKVGVGPGSICKTRIVTGAGMPQLTAIIESKAGAAGIPIVADGGIKNSGDVTKAIAAGASAVMIGSLFAGTDESPGELTMWNNRRSKLYRGMASLGAYIERKRNEKNGSNGEEALSDFVAEGADQVTVPYRGALREVLSQLVGGLRSGMSYCGASNIKELWEKAEFVKITDAGRKESNIHDVDF